MEPRTSDLSASVLRFLSDSFTLKDDLFRSKDIASDLRSNCRNLEASIDDLRRRFSESIESYALDSDLISSALGGVRLGLEELGSRVLRRDSDGLEEELSALTKEVARVEGVGAYAVQRLKRRRTPELDEHGDKNKVDLAIELVEDLLQVIQVDLAMMFLNGLLTKEVEIDAQHDTILTYMQ